MTKAGLGISQDAFEEARALALQAAATLAEANSQLALVRDGPRPGQEVAINGEIEIAIPDNPN